MSQKSDVADLRGDSELSRGRGSDALVTIVKDDEESLRVIWSAMTGTWNGLIMSFILELTHSKYYETLKQHNLVLSDSQSTTCSIQISYTFGLYRRTVSHKESVSFSAITVSHGMHSLYTRSRIVRAHYDYEYLKRQY